MRQCSLDSDLINEYNQIKEKMSRPGHIVTHAYISEYISILNNLRKKVGSYIDCMHANETLKNQQYQDTLQKYKVLMEDIDATINDMAKINQYTEDASSRRHSNYIMTVILCCFSILFILVVIYLLLKQKK